MGLKREEERQLASPQRELFASAKPQPKLRVTSAASNSAAKAIRLQVHKGMRIPPDSIISQVFNGAQEFASFSAVENLQWWSSSRGALLPPLSVVVEAIKVRDAVWAIITPAGNS